MREQVTPNTRQLTEELNSERLLRLNEVTHITAKPKATINREVRDGSFPAPFRIGKRAVAWKATDITAWMDALEKTVSVEG